MAGGGSAASIAVVGTGEATELIGGDVVGEVAGDAVGVVHFF